MPVSNVQSQRKVKVFKGLNLPMMMSYHSNAKRSKRNSFSLGELICCFCNERDTSNNLCAAGIMHAKDEGVNRQHVEILTVKLKTIATFLGDNALRAKRSTGDIVSNEIYYHKKCYQSFSNEFTQKRQMRKIVNVLR